MKHSVDSAKQKAKSKKRESAFCFWLLLFLALEILIIVVISVRSLLPAATPAPEPPPSDTDTTETPPVEDPEPPRLTLFETDSTKTVGSELYSEYAVLIRADTGEILAQKGSDARFYPASLTKVMTMIVACERLDADDMERKLVLRQELWDYVREGSYYESSVAGFDAEDEIKIIDLLYGIGMRSASDCCMLIADDIAGSEEAFVKLMNDKAAALELTDTHFDNVIGHESEENYSTPRDMAVIMAYAMQNELIAEILGTKNYEFRVSYYKTPDLYTDYRFTYANTLFGDRMETYQEKTGSAFALSSATLTAGKTGSFIVSSHIVCAAEGLDGEEYILVLGNAVKNGSYPPSVCTMIDIKTMLDTYVKIVE